jgi:coenzyme F420-dependent glucose-6-phosphate dehydrogenase
VIRIGYKASSEQFAPRELLDFAIHADAQGWDTIAISDHFQPFRHTGGHSPFSFAWMGALIERTCHASIGTSVITPTFRHHPSTIAQGFATLACLAPGRIFLGVGSGESLNEVPPTGIEWPEGPERLKRLKESLALIRQLWSEERVTFEGDYYSTRSATIYDLPDAPPPIYVAAAAPLASRYAGATADGFITTSGKPKELYTEKLLPALTEGAEKAGRSLTDLDLLMEIKLSYHPDLEQAKSDCDFWAPLALPAEMKHGVVGINGVRIDCAAIGSELFGGGVVGTGEHRKAHGIAAHGQGLGLPHHRFHIVGAEAVVVDRVGRETIGLHLDCPVTGGTGAGRAAVNDGTGLKVWVERGFPGNIDHLIEPVRRGDPRPEDH